MPEAAANGDRRENDHLGLTPALDGVTERDRYAGIGVCGQMRPVLLRRADGNEPDAFG
ncbi:hypothetical protein GCM10010399_39240 [Dactylosporangium fulvum]